MKNKNIEPNIIIAISAMKKVMSIFLGPFLTTYFIKTSTESISQLSIYYIISYIILAIISFLVASIIKNKFRLQMFRIGIILNFLYIMSIIVLKEKIIDNLWFIAILSGISAGAYWFPLNLFTINKIDNSNRTSYTVKSKIIASIIGILCPIILGSIITVTNYELTAIIILFVSLIQIILSFTLTPDEENKLNKFSISKAWNKIKNNKQVRKLFIVEFFVGMNASDGALKVLITILIFNSFKTDMNLGIITSITTILSMIFAKIYGRMYKNRNDKKIIKISSILPIIAVFILLIFKNNISVILYNICFVIFTDLLAIVREIRLFNISNSNIINKEMQCEFWAIREGILNLGRVVGYSILLLAGLSKDTVVLNIVLILLTLSIYIMGANIGKIERFEK